VATSEPAFDSSAAQRTRIGNSSIYNALTWLGVAVGAVLRFIHIGRESLWYDEGYTAWMVSHPAREIIRLIRADTAPPLYYLSLRAWTNLFGHSEVALRSLSAAASIGTLLLAVPLARRFVRSPVGVAAVIWALALGFHMQFYAQEARFYALMAFLTIAMLEFLQEHLSSGHRYWLIPLTVVVAASIYTHYMMAPYIAALAPLWLILPSTHSLRRRITDGILVAVGAAILFSPWAVTSLHAQLHFVHNDFWIPKVTFGVLFDLATWLLSVPSNWFWSSLLSRLHLYFSLGFWPGWIALLGFVAVIATILGKQTGERRRDAMGLLTFVLLPPALVVFYSLFSTPLVLNKVFLGSAAAMPFILLLPLGMEFKRPGRVILRIGAAGLMLLAIGILWTDMSEKKEDWRSAAQFVAQMPPKHRLILFMGQDSQLPFDYYHGPYRAGEDVTGSPAGFFDLDPPRAMLRVLRQEDLHHLQMMIENGHYEQVILVESHQQWSDPENLTLKYLVARFPNQDPRVDLVDLYDVSVWTFRAN
jgi:uncharacterized membrane protein